MRLSDTVRWLFYFPFRRCIVRLPRSIIIKIGLLMGRIAYKLQKRRRRIARDELLHLMGARLTENPDDIIRRGFQITRFIHLESFCFPRINSTNIDAWMRLKGNSNLDRAVAKNRGVIIILVHFGANQLVMAALGHRGYSINQLGSRPEDWSRLSGIKPTPFQEKLFNLQTMLEKALPARFVYIESNMKPVYQCLKSKEIVIMAVDGRAGTKFLSARVLDMTMNLSAGPFRIAYSTHAPIVPVFPVFSPNGPHTLHIEPELEIEPNGNRTEWMQHAASAFGKRLEQRLIAHPDHYCILMSEARIRAQLDPIPLFTESEK